MEVLQIVIGRYGTLQSIAVVKERYRSDAEALQCVVEQYRILWSVMRRYRTSQNLREALQIITERYGSATEISILPIIN